MSQKVYSSVSVSVPGVDPFEGCSLSSLGMPIKVLTLKTGPAHQTH